MRRSILLLMLAATAALLVSCSSPKEAAAPPEPAPAATLRAMGPSQIQSEIAASFPPEVPVVEGDVLSGKAQGDDAWDYEVAVDAPPSAVAEWYGRAYVGRQWVLVDEATGEDAGNERYTLTLRKGNAESKVIVVGEDDGSRASVILGVGAPVLQTQ